jgi:type I restriction enzyme S subunit
MKSWRIDRTEDYVTELGVRQSATRVAPAGSLVLVVRSGILQHTIPVAILGVDSALNQDMKAMIPGPEVDSRFIAYWINGFQQAFLLAWRKEGATVESLDFDLLRRTRIALPPLEHQHAIATFLDRKTAAIDALIARKERLIALLEEKRQALITQAVTKGLDPNVPMKDSGVEWLGEVPAGWNIKRLMFLTQPSRPIMYGIVLPGPDVEDGVPIVKSGDCVPERLSSKYLHKTTREIEASHARSRLRGGDLVYAIRGSIGKVAMVPMELEGANLTQDAARVATSTSVEPLWLLYALQSFGVWSQIHAGVVGATVKGINIRDLKRPFLPVPPTNEQIYIAKHISKIVSEIDSITLKMKESIDRLREYRQALITAAVTGKLEVAGRLAQEAESHDGKE